MIDYLWRIVAPIERPNKNILLTGRPGVGKSTLITRVLAHANVQARGFYTREIRSPAGREGFEAITLAGRRVVLAHVTLKGPYRVGKYGVAISRFEIEVAPSIQTAHVEPGEIIVVDEIGKMECFSAVFRQAVLDALDSPARVLGTVGLQNDPFLRRVRERRDISLIDVRRDNRDILCEQLLRMMEAAN